METGFVAWASETERHLLVRLEVGNDGCGGDFRNVGGDVGAIGFDLHGHDTCAVRFESVVTRRDVNRNAAFEKRGQV